MVGPESERQLLWRSSDLRGGLWFAAWWGWGLFTPQEQVLSIYAEGQAPAHSNFSGPCRDTV